MRAQWVEFLAFLESLPNVGQTSGPVLARQLRQAEATIYPLFVEVMSEDDGDQGDGVVTQVTQVPEPANRDPFSMEIPRSESRRRAANVEALRTYRKAMAEGRPLTGEERSSVRLYSGWGGITISALPEDPEAFDPEFITTIRAFKDAHIKQEAPPLIEGLAHQYFTPPDICAAVWRLVDRVREECGLLAVRSALEPSVGIGRFIQTSSVRDDLWTAVDLDSHLTGLAKALYPEARIYNEKFESWYVQTGHGEQFDIIIGNPPYPVRPKGDRRIDGWEWNRADDYFLVRCAELLAPGGVLCFVTLMSQLTSESRAGLRTQLLRRAHLATAVALPANIFPGAAVQTMAVILVGRPVADRESHEFTDRERAIIDGRYWELEPTNTASTSAKWGEGRWGTKAEGGSRWQQGSMQLEGEFDPQQLIDAKIDAVNWYDQLLADRQREATEPAAKPEFVPQKVKVSTRRAAPVDLVTSVRAMSRAVVTLDVAASALIYRISRFRDMLLVNPSLAEVGRLELQRDVLAFATRYGNPHDLPEVVNNPESEGLLAAVHRDGQLASWLIDEGATPQEETLPADVTCTEVIEHYSKWRGLCTEIDLIRHEMSTDPDQVLREAPQVAVQFGVGGEVSFYRMEEYLTGDLYARVDRIDAVLAGDPTEIVRARILEQKEAVLATLQTAVLADIEGVTPRAGFVSIECLQDYVNAQFAIHAASYETPAKVELTVVSGLLQMKVVRINNYDRSKAHDLDEAFALKILGYWNRQELVVNPFSKDQSKRTRRSQLSEVQDRMEEDAALENSFRDWLLGNDVWRPVIETAYNRAFRGFKSRVYSGDPLAITRWNPERVPRSHQNAAVRRMTDRRTGMLAHMVGYGKCRRATGLLLTNTGLVQIGSLFGDQLTGPEAEVTLPAPTGLAVVSHIAGQACWQPVQALYRQRISEDERTWVVTTSRGTTDEVTGAHPLLVCRAGAPEWVRTLDVRPGDWLAVAGGIPDVSWPGLPGFEDQTRLMDLAVLLAWQVAEGHERPWTSGESKSAAITQEDETVLVELEARYKRLLPGTSARLSRQEGRPSTLHIGQGAPYRELLQSVGYRWGHKSATKRFPDWFPLLPRDVLAQALSAYFEAESNVTVGAIEVTSASQELLTQVQYGLLRFGIRASLHSRQGRATNGKMTESKTYWRLVLSGEDAAQYVEHIGYRGTSYKQEAAQKLAAKRRNPNVGVPVRGLLDQLGQYGVTWAMLGLMRTETLQSVSKETALDLADQMERLAAYTPTRVLHGTAGAFQERTRQLMAQPEVVALLRRGAQALRTLVTAEYRFELVTSIEGGEAGGFVYDISLGDVPYDDANYVAGVGGLIAHNTLSGALTAAYWRQQGFSTRTLIVVPNGLVPNWVNEIRMGLPDYRVCVIGTSIEMVDGVAVSRDDDTPTRQAKWRRYAAGDYDVCICPYSCFTLDIDVRPATQERVLSGLFWLQRELGLDEEQRQLTEAKIAQATEKMERVTILEKSSPYGKQREEARLYARGMDDPSVLNGEDADQFAGLVRRVEKLQAEIETWKEKLTKPSDRMLNEIRKQLDEFTEDIDKTTGTGPLVWWEDLKVDHLIVDEAHNFKNLWGAGDRYGVSIEFMGSIGDKRTIRAWDMFIKCQELLERNNDGGVQLLTGTPIKNSPMEVYNLLCYVSRRIWTDRNVRSPEEFVDRYCELAHKLSVNKISNERKVSLIVLNFQGFDELRSIWDAFVDKRMDPLPEVRVPEGQRDDDMQVVLDDMQRMLTSEIRRVIAEKIEEAKEKAKEAGEGQFALSRIAGTFALRQMDLMSKVALDPRLLLVDLAAVRGAVKKKLSEQQLESAGVREDILNELPLAECEAFYKTTYPPKYLELARKITNDGLIKVGKEIRSGCGQVVFCDYNEPHAWIKAALVKLLGIKPERIALVNRTTAKKPAERQAIADGFNGVPEQVIDGVVVTPAREPIYDIVIGNSAIMSEGLNLQMRTCGLHHLTIPWDPATITQRNGRAVRQGNANDTVWLRYYVTPKSFDAVKLNEVLGKLGWQKAMFDETVKSITNPAVDQELDREEMLILAMSDDPETELAAYREQKQSIEAQDFTRRRAQFMKQFQALVYQYDNARRARDPLWQAAEFTRGDQMARALRLVPDALFPIRGAIDTARLARTYLNPETETVVYAGLVWTVPGRTPIKIQLNYVEPNGAAIGYREFGRPESTRIYHKEGVTQLLGRMKLPQGEVPVSEAWDDALDRAKILEDARGQDLPDWDPDWIRALGPILFDHILQTVLATVQKARDEYDPQVWGAGARLLGDRDVGGVLLKRDDGALLTAHPSLVRRHIQTGTLASLSGLYTYVLPTDHGAWRQFLDAVVGHKLFELQLDGRLVPISGDQLPVGRSPWAPSSMVGAKLARYWFKNEIPPKILSKLRG